MYLAQEAVAGSTLIESLQENLCLEQTCDLYTAHL